MEREVSGTVISVSKQWWLKVNRKPIRTGPLDGAEFPHVIKVKYEVDGTEYTLRKWIHAGKVVPAKGNTVKVFYRLDKPSKARLEF
ncbi:MAG: hypothetical protein IKY09_00255 [Methanocorpusculum sp.]|nr:hypothetical protein [Methanocorpusculum sp.]MBR5449837.1 hypothetical protein [Methanocorpusculum sp.]